jgi:hypothetical protein
VKPASLGSGFLHAFIINEAEVFLGTIRLLAISQENPWETLARHFAATRKTVSP